jgi:hypothetical protein
MMSELPVAQRSESKMLDKIANKLNRLTQEIKNEMDAQKMAQIIGDRGQDSQIDSTNRSKFESTFGNSKMFASQYKL